MSNSIPLSDSQTFVVVIAKLKALGLLLVSFALCKVVDDYWGVYYAMASAALSLDCWHDQQMTRQANFHYNHADTKQLLSRVKHVK